MLSEKQSTQRHSEFAIRNEGIWREKTALQHVYNYFYSIINDNIDYSLRGKIVEIGSGIGNIKEYINECICTDIFPNPWIDQIENAYALTFQNETISNIILFDVFHHLEFPGDALNELYRVLQKNGRVILFEPSISFVGLIIYGIFHHEPLGLFKKIKLFSDTPLKDSPNYYAAQGNASRIFNNKKRYYQLLSKWDILVEKNITSFAYIATGGYSKSQILPVSMVPSLMMLDKYINFFTPIFAVRKLIVLVKKQCSRGNKKKNE